jgi:hypothetical protein
MIDEPNSGLPGAGTLVPFSYCAGGTICTEYSNGTGGSWTTAAGTTPGQNLFQGVVNSDGKSITFNSVPINPPSVANTLRIFRITNLRANASAIPAGANTPGNVQALVSISGSSYVPLTQSQLVVGYVVQGLTASLRNTGDTGGLSVPNLNQCGSTTNSGAGTNVAILRYASNFGTAFKTRVLANTNANSGQDGVNAIQNIPGSANNAVSESGFILNGQKQNFTTGTPSGSTTPNNNAGLADFGTRFKAVFSNIPSGVSIMVSTTNVTAATAQVAVPSTLSTTNTYAQMVLSDTSPENFNSTPVVTATGSNGSVSTVTLTPAAGTNTVTAVWEVVNSNTGGNQNFDFAVATSYSSNVANNLPPAPSAVIVSMSYAPISTTVTASSSAPIPRFVDLGGGDNKTLFNIVICTTNLLFPYVTTITGFETGLAISNTTMDPFGTTNQAGACTLYWYGNNNGGSTNTVIPNSTTATAAAPLVMAGTTWTGAASAANMAGQNFTGYMIATCNFQLAHGYAAVTDVGTRGILTAYLALVMNGGRVSAAAETLSH